MIYKYAKGWKQIHTQLLPSTWFVSVISLAIIILSGFGN